MLALPRILSSCVGGRRGIVGKTLGVTGEDVGRGREDGRDAAGEVGLGEEDAEGERDDAFMTGLSQPTPASTTPIIPPGVRRQSSVGGVGVPILQQQRSSFSVGAGR